MAGVTAGGSVVGWLLQACAPPPLSFTTRVVAPTSTPFIDAASPPLPFPTPQPKSGEQGIQPPVAPTATPASREYTDQAGSGEIVCGECFEGQVRLIEGNKQAFTDYLYEAIRLTNPGLFSSLSINNLDDMKRYLAENDWKLPAGVAFMKKVSGRYYDVKLGIPLDKPVSLRNPRIELVSNESYLTRIKSGDAPLQDPDHLFFIYWITPNPYSVHAGLAVYDEGDHYRIALQVVHKEPTRGVGFPVNGSPITDGDVDKLDRDVRLITLVMMRMATNPEFDVDQETGIGGVWGISEIYKNFSELPNLPPPILKRS